MADAAMFGLAHRAVLLAPTEDAFDHGAARLRHAVALVPRGASVDGALAAFAGFGNAATLEAQKIGERTKAGMARAKARGIKIGRPRNRN